MTKELRELRTERPIGKSWYAFQEFVKHCIAGDKIVYLHPDFKLLSPKLHELEIIEAERRMKTEMLEWITKNRNTVTLVQIEEYLAISSLKPLNN